jgi:Fe2+ or Zn2+ uptake regulation protein
MAAAMPDTHTQQPITRRRRYYPSRLRRYRAELVLLRRGGASYRELAEWLRARRLRVAPSTVQRYLAQLPEMVEGTDGP